ncbi:MAG: dienelactone hydrolase family protein [Synechococcales cyanobacterium T60_A2020_003]|nr:dienelactone hydrolase family protein [Synechococcales cyanobacterium T60_A2020_003]
MSTIQTQTVQLTSGQQQIDAYVAAPVAAGSYPGVIVLQEIFGVNAHIRDITERFARLGYVAIAPALYQRLAPGFETGYTPDDITIGRVYKEQTKADELLNDIQAAADWLKAQPNVQGGIGCIGFCFGGHVAYLAATLPDIKATASFYGAGIPTWCPGEATPTIHRTPQIKGILHAFFGMDDASIPVEHVDQIEAALSEAHIPHQIWRYPGADHGFFCDRRGSYNADAAADAWEKVKALFQAELR